MDVELEVASMSGNNNRKKKEHILAYMVPSHYLTKNKDNTKRGLVSPFDNE
jgi:hypothetical protein